MMNSTMIDTVLGKLRLFQDRGEGVLRMLSYGVYRNTIRLYVREIKDNDFKKAKLLFNLPIVMVNMRVISDELITLSEKEEDYSFVMELFGPKWDKNQKRVPNEKQLVGKIGLAKKKNKAGDVLNLIFLENNAGVKYFFPINTTPYVAIYKNGKKIDDKTELSNIWTKAYGKVLADLLALFPEQIIDKDGGGDGNKVGNYKKSNVEQSAEVKSDSVDDLDDIL